MHPSLSFHQCYVHSSDELWHEVDLSESTHCIAQPQLLSKVEDVRKKAMIRGGGRIRTIRLLSEVISDKPLSLPTGVRDLTMFRQQRELKSRSSVPDMMKSNLSSPKNGML